MRRARRIWITLDSAGIRSQAQTAADAGCRRAEITSVDGLRPWALTMAWKWLRCIRL